MESLRHTLKSPARKLGLSRALHTTLITLTVASVAWSLFVLLLGTSGTLLLLVALVSGAVIVGGIVSAGRGTLDAARHVEQLAGWQERLSTTVELEEGSPSNVFYSRLRREATDLLRNTSPGGLIHWNLQRPAVLTAAFLLVAVVVTVAFPDGVLKGSLLSEAAERRQWAAELLEAETARLAELPLDTPGAGELRLELAGLLADLRRGGEVADLQRRAAVVAGRISANGAEKLRADSEKIATELGKSGALVPMSGAVRRMDPGGVRTEAAKVAEQSPGMSDAERRAAGNALGAAAGASRLPGLAEPLRTAAAALTAGDIERFRQGMDDFAAEVGREAASSAAEDRLSGEIRGVLSRVLAVLSGKDDPGRPAERLPGDFFVEGDTPVDKGSSSGNLNVRARPGDIREIWQRTHAPDVPLPNLTKVIEAGHSAAERGDLDPEYRDYVKKYFAVDSDNR